MDDTYKTISHTSEALYKEKMSRFISFAIPVKTVEEVKTQVDRYNKEFYDARHVCYAFVLGAARTEFRANDNGEPSGTAGKPILGQLNSYELTDILIVVVRYFGGVKLGTGGLVMAYREAAKMAIEANEIVEKTVDEEISVMFEYPFLNEVMRVVKEENPHLIRQIFEMECEMTLSIRQSLADKLRSRLLKIDTLSIL